MTETDARAGLAESDPSQKIIIFGTGSLGELVYYFFTNDSPHRVIGFTADREHIESDEKFGLPVVSFEEVEDRFDPEEYAMFIAVAYRDVNRIRKKKYEAADEKGYEFVNYIHSSVTIADNVEVGRNTFIFENQTIQPFVDIGNNVIIWSGNHIGHHSTIADHCFITSHVVISGHCIIEPSSFLGVNATLADGLTIAEHTIVGAGATMVEDTQPEGVYTGEAAQLQSENSSHSDI
jgi:sugar O-acyltransferase (sialic acid O-acetyltransferase NeuD family)